MKRLISTILVLALCWSCNHCWAQQSVELLAERLDSQAAEIKLLREQLDSYVSGFGLSPAEGADGCMPTMVDRVPLVMEQSQSQLCDGNVEASKFRKLNFFADYDDGFVIRPFDPKKHPFELKTNGWIQFRHHGFARNVDSWTDNAGVTRPVLSRNAFDIERARLVFSGHAIDPRLTYFLQLDGDTDGAHIVDFFDYWWGWQATDRFQIQVGKRKVPGSRQWMLSARQTRFVDRPMANDFFRPDRTVGIFGVGKVGETGHYELMLGNGFSTANIPNELSDKYFTLAATGYMDPLGDFGNSIVDFQQTDELLVRLGHSFVYSPQAGDRIGLPLEEAIFVRLSDGTRLTQKSALTPGVTVSEFDLYLYGLDFAAKYGGWSFNLEAYARWIEDMQGDGALPAGGLFDYGGYVEGGYFLVPKVFDVNGRWSQINGEFGNGSELAIGCNWYPLAKSSMKVSLDVTAIDDSPLQNTASDILVGDDGVLVRTQFQAAF